MKKKVLAALFTSMTLASLVVSGSAVLAEEVDSGDTEVGIGFTGHTPIDPDPTLEDLTLAWVPARLDFGSDNEVNTVATDFTEVSGANKYVVVKDNRTDDARDQWKLTAGLSDIMSGSSKLNSATLGFATEVKDYNGDGTEAPEVAGVITPKVNATATVASATQSLAQSTSGISMMTDATTSYRGFTAMELSDIKLSVPANVGQEGKQYVGTLTWSLDDTI